MCGECVGVYMGYVYVDVKMVRPLSYMLDTEETNTHILQTACTQTIVQNADSQGLRSFV